MRKPHLRCRERRITTTGGGKKRDKERKKERENPTFVVESGEGVEEFEGVYHRLDRWSVHEIEPDQVVDTHSLRRKTGLKV